MPKQKKSSSRIKRSWVRFYKSIWLFPVLLTIILITLTCFKLNGSSIGVYHELFYGESAKDSSLLFHKPQLIRSDEWLVNTPMTIAQANNHYQSINRNIGNGEDMTVILDVPNKNWSEAFRPHNWSFFVMPFDYAFAFKWWVMGYLLVLSAYFFVLSILPGRRLLAAIAALAFLYSPFIQWWYQYITLGPLYYSLFLATAFVHLLKQENLKKQLALGALISYLLACFALVLYPPFQIVCAIALSGFCLGWLIDATRKNTIKKLSRSIAILALATLVAGCITLLFIHTRSNVVTSIENTAYPGKRNILSGGADMNIKHLLSGHLSYEFLSLSHSANYLIGKKPTNQSDAANFILTLPFLLIPTLWVVTSDYLKKKKIDWPLVTTTAFFLALCIRILVPHFNWFFNNLLFLNKVPHQRVLMGLGLLSFIQLLLIIRNLDLKKKPFFPILFVIPYVLSVFVVQLLLARYDMHHFAHFITPIGCVVLSIPLTVAAYFLLRQRFAIAVLILLIFNFVSAFSIHPIYKGLGSFTNTPLSKNIKEIGANSSGKWASEGVFFENFASLNGAPSVSSVYTYPQPREWQDFKGSTNQFIFNRYAHVSFQFDRNQQENTPTKMVLVAADHFDVYTETCSSFMKQGQVKFIVAMSPVSDSCTSLIRTVRYPTQNFYIYRLSY